MEQYPFVFSDPDRAKRFVIRLAHYMQDLAIFRDGVDVIVIDGAEFPQREEILRLAKTSSATYRAVVTDTKGWKTID